MTEEQIRAIVRDEIEAECLKEGGLYDSTRQTAFAVVQSVTEMVGARMLDLFGSPSKHGAN